MYFYITSQENSPGGSFYDFKDGKPLQVTMDKNNIVGYNIQPQMTKYLRETGECQEEPYYKCIASQLDLIEINECSNKCIPKIFSNLGKNYSTPFCQNDNDNERCIIKQYHEQVIEEHQDFTTSCKKSCTNLEYFGEVTLNMPTSSEKSGNWHMYNLRYKLTNPNFELMVHEEYFIYDAISMIGSVGGTLGIFIFKIIILKFFSIEIESIVTFILGMFIGFSVTGTISFLLSYLKRMNLKKPRKVSALLERKPNRMNVDDLGPKNPFPRILGLKSDQPTIEV